MRKIWTPKSSQQHPLHPPFPLPEAPGNIQAEEPIYLFIPKTLGFFLKKPKPPLHLSQSVGLKVIHSS